MHQYIVRREQDFKRMEENSTEHRSQVSEQIRAMMLLCFGRLGPEGANLRVEFLQQHLRVPEDRPRYENSVSKLGWKAEL